MSYSELNLTNFRLQFITHSNENISHCDAAKAALDGGCRWIQLRMKNYKNEAELLTVANNLKSLCEKYSAIFIINDYVQIAKIVDASGVHLGKNDMNPTNAREILGKNKIIGGTANTVSDILNLVSQNVDYIGLGPFRFTKTKENLSQLLGIQGITQILNEIKTVQNLKIPIVTIGGITKNDIAEILRIDVDGIAISGAIFNAKNPINETKSILDEINNILNYKQLKFD